MPVAMMERMARRMARSFELLEHGKDSDVSWPAWLGTVRLILEEMREPTDAMINAFHDEIYQNAGAKWQVMINAALDE